MDNEYEINIVNGEGTSRVLNGTYDVFADVVGYDDITIYPFELQVNNDVDTYNLTIGASGKLLIHVTEDGTGDGIPVEGASFSICDMYGNCYGDVKKTNSNGYVGFYSLPYDTDNPPNVYFIEISSDGKHLFDKEVHKVNLKSQELSINIKNGIAPTRKFILEDINYNGINPEEANLRLVKGEDKYYVFLNNGIGHADIPNDIYKVYCTIPGYDIENLDPKDIEVKDNIDTYNFTVDASGKLYIWVTEEGEKEGTPVVGATFYRCTKDGVRASNPFVTNNNGYAIIPYLPYDYENTQFVYYVQASSDGKHYFDSDLKSVKLLSPSHELQMINRPISNKIL